MAGKMDWMYDGSKSTINREEYLLGKKIDANFEKTETDDKEQGPVYRVEHEILPGSVARRDIGQMQVDLKRKIKEDPLFQIRKQEDETMQELMENPIKRKQLERLKRAEAEAEEDEKKKKKSKKNKEKSIDQKLFAKMSLLLQKDTGSRDSDKSEEKQSKKKCKEKKAKKKKSHRKDKKRRRQSSGESSSSQSSRSPSPQVKKRKKSRRKRSVSSDSSSSDDGEPKRKDRRVDGDVSGSGRYDRRLDQRGGSKHSGRGHTEDNRSGDRSRADRDRGGSSRDRAEAADSNRNRASGHNTDRHRPERTRSHRDSADGGGSHRTSAKDGSTERSRRTSGDRDGTRRRRGGGLTEEEMEKKRKEMMDNARWRDQQRAENVARYDNERAREQQEQEQGPEKASFVQEQARAAAERGTVEGRIRSNRYNIQRSARDMDRSFVRR